MAQSHKKCVFWRRILTCRVMAWVRCVCHSQLIISENERVWITRLTMQFLMSKPNQGKQNQNQRRNKHNQQVYRKQNTNVPNDTNLIFLTITCDLCLQLFYPTSIAVSPVLKDTFCFKDAVQVACTKRYYITAQDKNMLHHDPPRELLWVSLHNTFVTYEESAWGARVEVCVRRWMIM